MKALVILDPAEIFPPFLPIISWAVCYLHTCRKRLDIAGAVGMDPGKALGTQCDGCPALCSYRSQCQVMKIY